MQQKKIICRVLELIDNSLGEKLTLQKLADLSGYSPVQLTRLFNEFADITPMRYVNTLRIIRSAQLLSDTDKRITDIAFECGFESLEVFERSFKKYFGVTAVRFRKSCFAEPDPFYLSAKIYYERLRTMLIDGGARFDWGKTAEQYAKYRDIYPSEFWETMKQMGVNGKRVLDIGTGTGVLPLNMADNGGEFIGADISAEMLEQAKLKCEHLPNVKFVHADAHCLPFEDSCFDAVTALQCWVYFDKEILIPELLRVLRPDGELYIAFMTWLPDEDETVRKSFELVRKYNHNWSGFMKRFDESSFDHLKKYFSIEKINKKDHYLHFTKEEWCGRMTASRGIGAALDDATIESFKEDMMDMLKKDSYDILHESVIIKLRKET
ncbi:methyltransferase domain-containing protein [Ruminococcus sp.]|uniref:methyltransferase domain-containing protein n=1 Tax=Ruminococcus sp. TaxID=41978 RepID=UPI00258AD4C7|nr:methyltransferase domain-containing protein [Ruminococcus sp.]MCR5019381.1 methyltransferase domain-containing protein [Ruminococcus sp.]